MPLHVALFAFNILSTATQRTHATVAIPTTELPAVAEAERIPLPARLSVTNLVVDPLHAQIRLFSPDPGSLAKRIQPLLGEICPTAETTPSAVVLRCKTKRLDAQTTTEDGRPYLDIRRLRGLPYRGPDQLLEFHYYPAPWSGAACPGDTPAARGECALGAGHAKEAALQFRLGMNTAEHAFSMVRLGDIARQSGDVGGALSQYIHAGTVGPFGHLAMARSCEITGSCLDDRQPVAFAVDASFVEPVATEVNLRAARADVFAGRIGQAIARLRRVLFGPLAETACAEGKARFCRRVLLAVLEDAGSTDRRAALEMYLALKTRTAGPYAVELARAAADCALTLGAPVFAGNLLASVFTSVTPEDLARYLLRLTDLYLAGGDAARSRVVLDYASTRLSPGQMSDARWVALAAHVHDAETGRERPSKDAGPQIDAMIESAEHDLAAANAALARAHGISR